jgi:hypothetical protein
MSLILLPLQPDVVKFCIFPFISPLDLAISARVSRTWKTYVMGYLNTRCWRGVENLFKIITVEELKLESKEELKASIMSSTNIRELKQKGGEVILLLSSTIETTSESRSSDILAEKIWSLVALEFAKLGYREKAYNIVNVKSLFHPPMIRMIEGELSKLKIKSYKNRGRENIRRSVLTVNDVPDPMKGDWRRSKIDFVGDVQQAYSFRHSNSNPVGFISTLGFPKTGDQLHSDLHVRSPIDKEGVVGIISQFLAVPSLNSCLLTAQISEQNIAILSQALDVFLIEMSLIEIEQYLLANRVPIFFGVLAYEWDMKNYKYYQSIDCCREEGVLTSIEIEKQLSKEITQQQNRRCTFQISRTGLDKQ